jgi:hypothetical protein
MNELIVLGFTKAAEESTDMQGHMDTIRRYSSLCSTSVEFGVYDCTSTWALLAGFPKRLTSYDIDRRQEVDAVEQAAAKAGIDFKFVLGDTAKVDIEPTELLFIDSFHTYEHLTKEFARHADKVSKFILLHDTVTFGNQDQVQDTAGNYTGIGLSPAINEFLQRDTAWTLHEQFTHCHGLTVLKRK